MGTCVIVCLSCSELLIMVMLVIVAVSVQTDNSHRVTLGELLEILECYSIFWNNFLRKYIHETYKIKLTFYLPMI